MIKITLKYQGKNLKPIFHPVTLSFLRFSLFSSQRSIDVYCRICTGRKVPSLLVKIFFIVYFHHFHPDFPSTNAFSPSFLSFLSRYSTHFEYNRIPIKQKKIIFLQRGCILSLIFFFFFFLTNFLKHNGWQRWIKSSDNNNSFSSGPIRPANGFGWRFFTFVVPCFLYPEPSHATLVCVQILKQLVQILRVSRDENRSYETKPTPV